MTGSAGTQYMNQLTQLGKAALARWAKTPEQKAKGEKDLAELEAMLKSNALIPGPCVSFSYMTARGSESFAYDWNQYPGVDASKPLGLLYNLGKSPIFAYVSRSRSNPSSYDQTVKWLGKLYDYFVEIGLPQLEQEQQDHFKTVAEALLPILRRFSDTTRTKFIPGFADGQFAFVLDGQTKTSRVHMVLPDTPQPMPIPELALLLGVADAKLVREAFADYRTILNDLLAKIREMNGALSSGGDTRAASREKERRHDLYLPPVLRAGVRSADHARGRTERQGGGPGAGAAARRALAGVDAVAGGRRAACRFEEGPRERGLFQLPRPHGAGFSLARIRLRDRGQSTGGTARPQHGQGHARTRAHRH